MDKVMTKDHEEASRILVLLRPDALVPAANGTNREPLRGAGAWRG